VKTPYHWLARKHIIAGMSYQSVNPYNGKLLNKFEDLIGKQPEAALKSATTHHAM
jgi:hypothetical protein